MQPSSSQEEEQVQLWGVHRMECSMPVEQSVEPLSAWIISNMKCRVEKTNLRMTCILRYHLHTF